MTVTKQLIEDVQWLKKSISQISVYDLNVYSVIELYYNIATKLNEVIRELGRFEGLLSEEIINQNEKLTYLLGEGLKIEVGKKIQEMVEDGTMDTIINHKIFGELNKKIVDIDKEKLDKKGGVLSRQLFGSKNDAVTIYKTNIKNPNAPVTPNELEDIANYGGVDQSIDVKEFWTNDDDGEYVGIIDSVISTTPNTVTITNTLGDYPIKGMIVALYTDLPSQNNISYLGKLQVAENNKITVDKWVSMTSKVVGTPSNIKYAVIGVCTKMYVDYNYIRARSGHDWLTSIVGSQQEMRNSSKAYIIGYHATLRHDENNRGGVGFEVGTQNECKWTSAFDLNGKAKYLLSAQSGAIVDEILHVNGENLINGNGAMNRCWSSSSSNTPTPILNITSDTNLSTIGYNKDSVFTIRNNSNSNITLSCNSENIYCDGVKMSTIILKGYSSINVTTNGNDSFWLNAGNTIKSATFTSTTGTNGNISLSTAYSNKIVISAESLNYIVLIRKISDRYTIYVYTPTSTGLTPVTNTEITYTINFV